MSGGSLGDVTQNPLNRPYASCVNLVPQINNLDILLRGLTISALLFSLYINRITKST